MAQQILHRFLKVVAEQPDRIALITEKSQISFGDLEGLVQVLDLQTSNSGIKSGQTIVLATRRLEFVIAFMLLASFRGFTLVFASDREVIAGGLEFDQIIGTETYGQIDSAKQIIITSDWFALIGSLPAPNWNVTNLPEAAFVTATSGTTGRPKFIKMSETAKLSDIDNMRRQNPEDLNTTRFISAMPPNASVSLNMSIAVLLDGGAVISPNEQTTGILQTIDLWNASHFIATPAIIQTILNLDNCKQFLRGLKEIAILGAASPNVLLQKLRTVTSAQIVTLYGASETGAIFENVFDVGSSPKDNCLGRLYRNDLTVGILNNLQGENPTISEGEAVISFLSPAARSYVGDADIQPKFDGQEFVTGDILRKEGDIWYYVGRNSLIYNQNGSNYSLESIEGCLLANFQNTFFASTSYSDSEGMEALCIYYAGDATLKLTEIEIRLSRHWPRMKVGRVIQLSKIPRGPTGKIDRQKLPSL